MLASKLLTSPARGCRVSSISSRSLCHKSKLTPRANNYKWPYDRRSYGLLNFWMDPFTSKKFNENSLIIQVEGNISAGKEEFAKALASELDMTYLPQPDLDSYYVNDHGYDYRALNVLLPERLRLCDWKMFHENPARHSMIHMQYYLFRLRLFQYVKALQHLFNTGQGVVMTRSVFTERVMVEAMHNIGWLPKGHVRSDGVRFYDWKNRHIFMRNLALYNLHKPHLCIYLDTPVEVCLENIRNDPDPMIANSKAHTREFLQELETAFKDHTLPRQEHNMHLHVVEHKSPKTLDEVRDIIDDLESLSFEFDVHDTRFEDWDPKRYSQFHFTTRRTYTSRVAAQNINDQLGSTAWFDIAGLGDSISDADLKLRTTLYESNAGPFGYLKAFSTDSRVSGIFSRLFGPFPNFGQRQERACRTDFI